MKARPAYLRISVRTGFWFVPGTMPVGAIALSFITLYLDKRFIGAHAATVGWLVPTGLEGARPVLGTVACVDRRLHGRTG